MSNVFTARDLGLKINFTTTKGYTFNHEIEGTLVDKVPEDGNAVAIYVFDSKDEAEAFWDGMTAAGLEPCYLAIGYGTSSLPNLLVREFEDDLIYQDILDLNGFEEGDIPVMDMTKRRWAIYSPNESAISDGAGWWNNELGWTTEEEASRFTSLEKVIFQLPMSTGQDAQWVRIDEVLGAQELRLIPKRTREDVGYWNGRHYGGDEDSQGLAFECEVNDLRKCNGKVMVDMTAKSGALDEGLFTTFEINRLPEEQDDMPCVHVAFDCDNLAVSIFKQGDQMILRVEDGVSMESIRLKDGGKAFVLK